MKAFFTILVLFCTMSVFSKSMFQITLQQAQDGDPQAMNNVAVYYKEAGDCEKAYFWYQQAISKGDPLAEYGMGQCYALGCGTEQNFRIAITHFRRAADKGVKEAALVLAEMYRLGIGVKPDESQVAYWKRIADKCSNAIKIK